MVQGKPLRKVAPKAKAKPAVKKQVYTTTKHNQLSQNLLDIFKHACVDDLASDFETTLQEVKGHLFNRDFAAAFGRDEHLQAYAARWSPSRTLGYLQVFRDLEPYFSSLELETSRNVIAEDGRTSFSGKGASEDVATLSDDIASNLAIDPDQESLTKQVQLGRDGDSGSVNDLQDDRDQASSTSHGSRSLELACIGGGAGAEIVALAGWLKTIHNRVNKESLPERADVLCLDIAGWDNVVKGLHQHCIAPRKLSKYASASAQAANVPLVSPDTLSVKYQQRDVLDLTVTEAIDMFSGLDVVTILFTMNELYTASVSKSQRFLHNLTASLKPGALLLVVDSPGTYSSVTINGAEKKYPMQWLLDHTLLQTSEAKDDPLTKKLWEKLVDDESRWFRLPEGLNYPIELENMRYQIHLYRRCGNEV